MTTRKRNATKRETSCLKSPRWRSAALGAMIQDVTGVGPKEALAMVEFLSTPRGQRVLMDAYFQVVRRRARKKRK